MRPNRPIPKIGTLLVLGGCYEAHQASLGGGGGLTTGEIAKAYCEQREGCDPEYFAVYYGSIPMCTDLVAYELEYDADAVGSASGEPCAEAFLEYYECFVGTITGCQPAGAYAGYPFTYDYAALDACYEAAVAACPAFLDE